MSWHPPYTLINTWRHGVQGRAAQGMQQMRQELETYEANNAKLALPYYLGLMAGLCQRAGDTAAAIATVTRALAVGQETGERWNEAELYRLIGRFFHPKAVGLRPRKTLHNRHVRLQNPKSPPPAKCLSLTGPLRLAATIR